MITIARGSKIRLATNFTTEEFFTKCRDFFLDSHFLDIKLVMAAQLIRDFASSPVLITSSFRTPKCNAKIGGAPDSYHLSGLALDLYCNLHHDLIVNSITERGILFKNLRSLGINGFGVSTRFLHIDVRTSGHLFSPDSDLPYDFWHY